MSHEFVETLKEFLRVAIIAAIPVLIDGLTAGLVDWRLAGIAAAIAALRALDKFLHESDVSTPLDLRGLDALKG